MTQKKKGPTSKKPSSASRRGKRGVGKELFAAEKNSTSLPREREEALPPGERRGDSLSPGRSPKKGPFFRGLRKGRATPSFRRQEGRRRGLVYQERKERMPRKKKAPTTRIYIKCKEGNR